MTLSWDIALIEIVRLKTLFNEIEMRKFLMAKHCCNNFQSITDLIKTSEKTRVQN